jgi:hypothetical protein
MDAFLQHSAWQQLLAAGLVLLGLAVLWRGLRGEPDGARGLLRRNVDMLDRLEGWRLSLAGLTLAGFGAGWLSETRWLVVLSLGIGFVELQEATHVIRAWRWGSRPRPTSATRAGPAG